jgi:uncharacterized LabA/DUF88 family protein
MKKVICYVDGFNLYHGLRSKGWKKYYWLDAWKLAERFLLPDQELIELVYSTARVKKKPKSRERQRAYIDALEESYPKLSVIYGHYLAKEVRCKNCGHTYLRHEEMMTDVNIACKLLLDAVDGKFDTAIIISGDSDLVPPIRIIKAKFPEKRVLTLFSPKRFSVNLCSESHGWRRIAESDLWQSQLPKNVNSQSGTTLLRPSEWV